MTPEINLIKLIIKNTVNNSKENIEDLLDCSHINWEKFKHLIIYHDLSPFAYLVLREFDSFLHRDLIEFLKNNYYCALARCQNLWQEFLRISDAFEQARIIIVPIKGVALLEDIYIQFPVRPMTDIDLLVKEEDIPRAEAVFCDLGYRKELYGLREEYWRESQCHITFYKKKEEKALFFVELHWSLDFKRKNRTVLSELWARIREIDVDGRTIKLLSPEDTLFSLALHNRRLGRTLCLKNVYDLILLLNKYASNFDWNYCLRIGRKYSLNATLFFILYQAKFLLEVNIPKFVWKGLNLSTCKQNLIQHFIERNTFLTDSGRNGENLYLRSHFLLYDTFWEPIAYILNIPKEQFAKYYGLQPYDKRTDFLYKVRLLYMPFQTILNLFKQKLEHKRRFSSVGINNEEEQGDGLSLFETTGFSMWPFLQAGERLIIKKVPIENLRVGDIILYRVNNHLVCHRLVKKVQAKEVFLLYVRADNSMSLPELLTSQMFLGKAIGIIKHNKTVNLSTRRQRFMNCIIVIVAPLMSICIRAIVPLGRWLRKVCLTYG